MIALTSGHRGSCPCQLEDIGFDGCLSKNVFVQAVTKLKDEIAGFSEEECGDALVLPLYAALPPDQQVTQLLWSAAFGLAAYHLSVFGNVYCFAIGSLL